MKSREITMRLLNSALMLIVAGCSATGVGAGHTSGPGLAKENAELWRKVTDGPPAYVPQAWPRTLPTGPSHGKWIVDARDATSYFVPNTTFGGLTPGVWEGEALKATHRYTQGEELRRKAGTVLVRWPAKAAVSTLMALPTIMGMAAAGGGALSPGSIGAISPGVCGTGGSGACSNAGGH